MNTEQFKAVISAYYYDNFLKTNKTNCNIDALYSTLKTKIPKAFKHSDYEECVRYIAKMIKY
jgi:hypothetical protein